MFYIIKDNQLKEWADYKFADNCKELKDETMESYNEHPNKYIVEYNALIPNPDYKQEEIERRKQSFNKEFFNTSLGYIRRSVTMSDGTQKDFLSDLLPTIAMGVNMGQEVKIIAYYKPPFTKDITDWTKYQHNEIVTPQFIQECFIQLQADFGAIKLDNNSIINE